MDREAPLCGVGAVAAPHASGVEKATPWAALVPAIHEDEKATPLAALGVVVEKRAPLGALVGVKEKVLFEAGVLGTELRNEVGTTPLALTGEEATETDESLQKIASADRLLRSDCENLTFRRKTVVIHAALNPKRSAAHEQDGRPKTLYYPIRERDVCQLWVKNSTR
jgi:hypothetical protein